MTSELARKLRITIIAICVMYPTDDPQDAKDAREADRVLRGEGSRWHFDP